MLRIIAGIVVGLIVIMVLVLATFVITTYAMGDSVDGFHHTLQPDSYWTTDTFNIIVLIGGLVASIIGGLVCNLIARNPHAGFALATILLVMGSGSFMMNMNKPDPPARAMGAGPVTMQQMQEHGKEPTWFALGKTALGAIGVLIGASMVKTRNPARSQASSPSAATSR